MAIPFAVPGHFACWQEIGGRGANPQGVKYWAIPAALAALTAAGCSGGQGDAATRSAAMTMRIAWPETTTRAIPQNARSVQVTVRDALGFSTFRVANRPGTGAFSTLSFFGLAPGEASIEAKAYSQSDAQGVAVAVGTSTVTLEVQKQATGTVTLASTVDQVAVTPATLNLAIQESATLTGTARDAAGDIVPLATGRTRWRSDNTAIATVDTTGRVRGVSAGTTTVTFTDDESGKSGSATVTVAASS